jgi:osmotically-inducible protein OsmY
MALALCFTLFQGHAAMAVDLGNSAKKVGRYMGDSAITTAVKSKFMAQKGLDSLDLHVVTQNGIVTLRGQVTSESQQQLAVKVAKETEGVRKVVNKISVMP